MGVESEENMTKWMNKLSVAACALLLAGSVACGNNEENNDSNNGPCADGEINVAGGSLAAGCYKDCTADAAACGATQECKTVSPSQKLCVEKPTVMDPCPAADEVEASWKGETKCYKDCSADANVCTGDNECKTAGSESICVPKDAVNPPTCMDGEVETVVGGGTAQCYKKCTGNPDCAADNKICASDDGGANMICITEPEEVKLCNDAADLLFGSCALNNCGGLTDMQKMGLSQTQAGFLMGAQGQPGCEARARQDQQFKAQLQQLVAAGCDSALVKLQQCGLDASFADVCGCSGPDHSKGCTTDADCSGTLQTTCQAEDANTGTPPGGICLHLGCHQFLQQSTIDQVPNGGGISISIGDGMGGDAAEQIGCTLGDYCFVFKNDQGQVGSFCREGCKQNSDCDRGVTGADDSGYACTPFGSGEAGLCIPACNEDADCASDDPNAPASICNKSTRLCEAVCDANTMCDMNNSPMGAACTPDAQDNTRSSCSLAQPYGN